MIRLHRDFRGTSPAELRAISDGVMRNSAASQSVGSRIADAIVVVVLGLLDTALFWHWLAYCDGASLCMAAVVGMPRRRPHIPAGCDQQGRMPAGRGAMTHEELRSWPWGGLSRPGLLTEAELDQHNHEMHPRSNFGELLFFGGAVSRHRGRGLLERLRRAWRNWRAARRIAGLGPRL